MRWDAILLGIGLLGALLPIPALLFTPYAVLVPAGVLTLLGRLNPAIGVPSWAMYVWFAGALWVGFISVFGGWFVSQM